MVRKAWKAVALGGAALGTLGLLLTAVLRRPAPAPRIALIGDSYAVGLTPLLEKALPDFKGEGYVGAGTPAYKNLPAWLLEFKPSIALVSLGVNDGFNPKPENYQAVVRALHGIGARVIWIEPPAAVRNDEVRRVIASLGVRTIPATSTPLADGLHPKSYAPWANEIVRALNA